MVESVQSFLEASAPTEPLAIPIRDIGARSEGAPYAPIVVPVGAHQENLEGTIRVYDNQQLTTPRDTHLYLFLNAPSDQAGADLLEQNVDFLERLTAAGDPHLPISWCLRLYNWQEDESFSMGKVTAEAWWHMLADNLERTGETPLAGFTHHADTLFVSPHYLSKAARLGEASTASVFTPDVLWDIPSRERYGSSTPALNRLFAYMGLSEEAFRQATLIQPVWDYAAGFSVPAYIRAGGYRADYAHTEAQSVVEAIKADPATTKLFERLDGEVLVSSARRYVDRIARGESPFDALDPHIQATEDIRTQSPNLASAERTARANLGDWCKQADDNNIRIIERVFGPRDGTAIELRLNFYRQLANPSRRLLNAGRASYDSTEDEGIPATRESIARLAVVAQALLED